MTEENKSSSQLPDDNSNQDKVKKVLNEIEDVSAEEVEVLNDIDNLSREELIDLIKNTQLIDVQKISMQSEVYSGPLPHPAILKQYEDVMPGAADRIFKMAERQASSRQENERSIIKAESRDSLLGEIFAFIISMFGIGGGIWLINSGNTAAGSVLSALCLGSIVASFITGTRAASRSTKKESSQPQKAETKKQKQNKNIKDDTKDDTK